MTTSTSSSATANQTPPRSWLLSLSGAVAGLCNGFFGAGGGTLVVPALDHWGGLPGDATTRTQTAHATALTVILPFALVTLGLYIWRGLLTSEVFWRTVPVMLGSLPGGFLGGKLLAKLSGAWLHRIFGLLMAAAALHLIFGK